MRLEQPRMPAVAAGQRERLEQPRHAMVEDGAIVAACLVAERAGDPAFADAGRAGDQQVVLALDPVAGDEAWRTRLGRGRAASRRSMSSMTAIWRSPANFSRVTRRLFSPFDDLAVDHQGEPLLEGERGGVGLAALIVEGLGHAGQAEGDRAFVGGLGEHGSASGWSVVVAAAADVAVVDRIGGGSDIGVKGLVEAGLQDRGDRAVARGADAEAARQAASRRTGP